MKLVYSWAAWFLLLLYLTGYLAFRIGAREHWERDGRDYLISALPIFVYYIYRPLSWLDSKLTGQRFHIGLPN